MKLTKKQINKIKELRNEGEKVENIANKFNTTKSTITYWTNDESRRKSNQRDIEKFKKLTLKERQEIYKQRLPYLTDYQFKRYHEDKAFREKKMKCSERYYKEKVKKNENM